jgi:hypothetical protein
MAEIKATLEDEVKKIRLIDSLLEEETQQNVYQLIREHGI